MIDLIGTIASVMFILATMFQAVKAYRDGHSESISHGLLWNWAIGLIFMLIYVVTKIGLDYILISCYTIQLSMVLIIMKYKYLPRNNNG
ncbi:MAG TPA: hypothetical protein VMV86_05810 [Methanosarcinales archaeon]|nr:hypothetical protein [Methanosarcinales archaeon]